MRKRWGRVRLGLAAVGIAGSLVGHAPATAAGSPSSVAPAGIRGTPLVRTVSGHRLTRHLPVADLPLPSAREAAAKLAAPTPGTWSSLGPQPIARLSTFGSSAGRVTAMAANGSTVYAGAADGGVWKSTDAGAHWTALTDSQATLAIGSLAVDWSTSPETIYAGTGEGNHCQDCLPSQGLLKSSNGGNSWTLLGQATFTTNVFFLEAIAVDHSNPAIAARVLAATNHGLYLSTDAASTWAQVLAGETDAVIQDPATPTKFWAAQADHHCTTTSGALRGSIAVSTDSGNTWSTQVTFSGLPAAVRIGLGVGANATAYAAVAACPTSGSPSYGLGQLAAIEKTTNGGTSWQAISPGLSVPDYFSLGSTPAAYQGWYDNVVGVDPTNPAHAVFGGVTMLTTTDGGTTFTDVAKPYSNGPLHPDFHALAFTGAGTFYAGNDGGVYLTSDFGGTGLASDWTNRNLTLSITQFYFGSSPDLGHVVGGSQDNGTAGIVPGGPAQPTWKSLLDGDGGWTALIPNSSTIYAEVAGLDMFRVDSSTGALTEIAPCPNPFTDSSCIEPVGFIAPFVRDSSSVNGLERLYAGTNRVYRTTSGGRPAGGTGPNGAWSAVSGDVTAGTVSTPAGPQADFINTMAIGSGSTSATVITGSWYGRVFTTANGADPSPSWADITGTGGPGPLPAFDPNSYTGNPWITAAAVNPADRNEAWVTVGRVSGARVFHTTNATASPTVWSDITGAIPNVVIDSLTVDPVDPHTLYLGTDTGPLVWCASCGGGPAVPNWVPLGSGLPNARVDRITLTTDGSSIVAWTHGRGAWSLARPFPTPQARLNPASLTFASQNLGTTSPPKPITLTNDGTGPLTIRQLGTTGDFGQTSNCPAIVAQQTSCTINVTFTPTANGNRTGTLTVIDDAADSPQTVSLVGDSAAGYWLVARDGGIFTFGNANYYGSTGGIRLNQPVVGMGRTPDDGGYWLVASDGGMFTFGDAEYFGSTGAIHLNKPVVGMAATPDGKGYWLVASDGGIFSFGDAQYFGSTGAIRLNKPVVGMAATPDGKGYWLVASDGGIFTFGDAQYFGSTGAIRLNKPVVGIAATPDGKGYWLVASDGGIFNFGDARYFGSTGALHLNRPVVTMAATGDGSGYWLTASDGGIFTFGDAAFLGSMGGQPINQPVVGMAAS